MDHVALLFARARSSSCTLDTCPVTSSYYYYRISLAANAAFLALFSLSLIGFVVTSVATRRSLAFSLALIAGVLLEIIGYAGRIMSWVNQWSENGFLIQIVCLTIGPAFMAGGIYLSLRRIIYAFGPENSRISPEAYTRIFIPCDILSLLLQAAGGGLASAASHSGKSVDLGDHIMVAGLAFQVFTLLVFMALCVDFAMRTTRRHKAMGEAAFDQNPVFVQLRSDWKFKGFLCALAFSTICIFWRSVYRVVELGQGWTGDLIRQQNYFIGFEGVMVVVACLALNLFHPAICFKQGEGGLGGFNAKRRARKAEKKALEEEGTVVEISSGSGSDAESTPSKMEQLVEVDNKG